MGNVQRKQQSQEQIHPSLKEEEADSKFTCQICFEPVQSSTNKFRNSTLCRHPFCLECIANYIEVRVSEGTAPINCPAFHCDNPLDPLSCRTFIPNPLFDRWSDQVCESALQKTNRCYCPYRNCSTLILDECGDTVRKTTCPNCKRAFCFKCKVPWHAGYWCRESRQRRDQNDALFGKLLERKKWMRCGKCGHAIEHTGGCSLITCRCGSKLCKNCGRTDHPLRSCEHQNGLIYVYFLVLFWSSIVFVCSVLIAIIWLITLLLAFL